MFRITWTMVAVAAITTVGLAAGPGLAQAAESRPAAPASTSVPCNAATLASDIAGAASGATLGLAAHCTYTLTAALPAVSQDLTIKGNAATLERSSSAPAFTILSQTGGTLSVSNLNFTDGQGAIAVNDGNLTVNGGKYTGNQASKGGAIDLADGPAGTDSITGATFSGNSATTGGGAIYNGLNANTTITKCTFSGNTTKGSGGAIYDFAVYGATINNSTFKGNSAASGGAIASDPIGGESLTQDTISGNSASQDGGGISNAYASMSIHSSTITGNQAGGDGGGLYQYSLEYGEVGPSLTDTKVTKNSAADGGGIYNNASVADLTGSTVSANTATADGGGIDNAGDARSYDTVNLGTSKITSNQAGADGGGIYNVGEVAATGTSITYNTATGGGGLYNGPGTDTVTLTTSPVQHNKVDNCEPSGSITGCTG